MRSSLTGTRSSWSSSAKGRPAGAGVNADQKIFDEPLPAGASDEGPADANDSLGHKTAPDKNDLNEERFAVRYSSEFRSEADGEKPLKDIEQMFANYQRMEISAAR